MLLYTSVESEKDARFFKIRYLVQYGFGIIRGASTEADLFGGWRDLFCPCEPACIGAFPAIPAATLLSLRV